ncbi:unnamed protein product [Ambrosiozyma monospora]|uniref:Unnamed protein product n=1 Tax=Ambrosiozyma monospora TaxID=43982 RepID=A0ACB5U169_AMBMO|nr:unnamed protein product [Ambrosiozyma monospora]
MTVEATNTTSNHKSGKTVLVTGANGYLAGHIVDGLLSKGYNVIGTVRSLAKSEPFEKVFKEKYPNSKIVYEVVSDITAVGGFDYIFKKYPEIKIVLHCAASTAMDGTGTEDLKDVFLTPTLEGTKQILTRLDHW